MVDVLKSFDCVTLSKKVLTSLQTMFCNRPVPIAQHSLRLNIRKVLLVDELDGSLNAKCEHAGSSHPGTGEVHIVQDVLHHVQPLTEVDVIKELPVVGHSVVPGLSLKEDLA